LGIHGQSIHVDPARNLVIVVNSAAPGAVDAAANAARIALYDAIRAAFDAERRADISPG